MINRITTNYNTQGQATTQTSKFQAIINNLSGNHSSDNVQKTQKWLGLILSIINLDLYDMSKYNEYCSQLQNIGDELGIPYNNSLECIDNNQFHAIIPNELHYIVNQCDKQIILPEDLSSDTKNNLKEIPLEFEK